jgi:hypothetical protein
MEAPERSTHDIIVVGQRRERRLGQRDAEVSVRCRTCLVQTSERTTDYRTLWEGPILEAHILPMIIHEHEQSV